MLALIYDVHGNLHALEAVLADAAEMGATRHLLGGDYALFGPAPRETVARLQRLPAATWLRGNGERWTADPAGAPADEPVPAAIAACRAALGGVLVRALAQLPEQAEIDGALCCHASPPSDVRFFSPEPAPDEGELLEGVRAQRLVFGHTHVQFSRVSHAAGTPVELVNPGSVGMPFDGDVRAAYALIDADGSLLRRRVAYDHQASADALRERFDSDWAEIVARRIERAQMDV